MAALTWRALVGRLNAACRDNRPRCRRECIGTGWCERCWEDAKKRR